MNDSLHTAGEMFAGIPDTGIRITAMIICGFVIAVLILLLSLKIKEQDEEV